MKFHIESISFMADINGWRKEVTVDDRDVSRLQHLSLHASASTDIELNFCMDVAGTIYKVPLPVTLICLQGRAIAMEIPNAVEVTYNDKTTIMHISDVSFALVNLGSTQHVGRAMPTDIGR